MANELNDLMDDINLRMTPTRNGLRTMNVCPSCGCIHGEAYLEGEMGSLVIRDVERFESDMDIRCLECGAMLDPPPSPSIKLCVDCLNKMRFPTDEEMGMLISETTCEAL